MRLSYSVGSGGARFTRRSCGCQVRVSGTGFSHRFQLRVGLAAGPGRGFLVVGVGQGEPDDLVKWCGGRVFTQPPVAFLAEAVLRGPFR